jgi:adenylyl-sulfate kinase
VQQERIDVVGAEPAQRLVTGAQGDDVRTSLSKGLGFSREDREASLLRIAYVARLLARNGVVVIVATISPYADIRQRVREGIDRFVEVHVDCSIAELTRRDPKGLYQRALRGEIANFTGISDPYERPERPEIRIDSERESEEDSLTKIIAYLRGDHLPSLREPPRSSQ